MSRPVAEPTRIRSRDVIGEAGAVIAAQPLRSALTATGTLLAVAGFVVILGFASTAAGRITSAFNQRLPTEVRVTAAQPARSAASNLFPPDVERRLGELNGVLASGLYWRLAIPRSAAAPAGRSAAAPAGRPAAAPAGPAPALFAASPGFLAAAGAQVSQGRLFSTWDQARAEPVCLLGARAARQLGVTSVEHRPAVVIGGVPCTVIGIISHVASQPWIIRSVLMPSSAAIAIWHSPPNGPGADPGVLIRTRLGAAKLIASQAPFAINPDDPALYLVTVPPSPARLRSQVSTIMSDLFLALVGIGLLVGAAGIANVTMLSVGERAAEIGLRRALGARRRHIAAHILAESSLLGLLGGIAGTSLGVIVVVLVAIARGWTPVIAPQTVLPAPLIGAAAGLLAGLYPSWRAARIEPARALNNYPPA